MGIVRLWTAELVVGLTRPEGAIDQVLQLATPTHVTDHDVELAVGPESDHTAIVVAPLRLIRVLLQGTDLYQVLVPGQLGSVPDEPVNPVAEQRRLAEHVGVGTDAALGPIQVNPRIGREVRVQGDPQQPTLRPEVHRQVQHRGLDHAVHNALHLSGVLLQHQQVILAQERQADRRDQPARHRLHRQPRVQHDRIIGLGGSRRAEHGCRKPRRDNGSHGSEGCRAPGHGFVSCEHHGLPSVRLGRPRPAAMASRRPVTAGAIDYSMSRSEDTSARIGMPTTALPPTRPLTGHGQRRWPVQRQGTSEG